MKRISSFSLAPPPTLPLPLPPVKRNSARPPFSRLLLPKSNSCFVENIENFEIFDNIGCPCAHFLPRVRPVLLPLLSRHCGADGAAPSPPSARQRAPLFTFLFSLFTARRRRATPSGNPRTTPFARRPRRTPRSRPRRTAPTPHRPAPGHPSTPHSRNYASARSSLPSRPP